MMAAPSDISAFILEALSATPLSPNPRDVIAGSIPPTNPRDVIAGSRHG
jgi:hypothetical protein